MAYGGKESVATVNNDVRFINIKIGVQRRKSRDGVVVSTSARQAGGPWFDSRSRRDRFLNANLCLYIYIYIYVYIYIYIYIYTKPFSEERKSNFDRVASHKSARFFQREERTL